MWLSHNGQCVQVFAGHDGGVSCGELEKNMLHLRKKISEDGKRKEGRKEGKERGREGRKERREGKKDGKKVEVKNSRI